MSDSIDALKCLEQPWRDVGFNKMPNDHAPCPFHDGSDHFSIFKDSKDFWRFKCHNDGRSGSIIDLWAELEGLDDAGAITELVSHYIDNDVRLEHKEREQVERRETVYPEPTDFDAGTPDLLTSKSGQPRPGPSHGGEQLYFGDCSMIDAVSARWDGRDQTIAVCRWDLEDGAKVIRPFHKSADDRYWQYGQGLASHERKPLHRLEYLRQNPNTAVILVEGEKCVRAVEDALEMEVFDIEKAYLATTVIGGTNSTPWTDMSLLEGREVIVLPDMDEPGALWIDKLKSKIAPFKVIWPADLDGPIPESGGLDVADRLADGVRLATILERPAEWVYEDQPDDDEERDPDIFRPGYVRMSSEPIENYEMQEHITAEGESKMRPAKIGAEEIIEKVQRITGGFPRTAAGIPFVRGKNFGQFDGRHQIEYLTKQVHMQTWLNRIAPLIWTNSQVYDHGRKTMPISIDELKENLKIDATHKYDLVESIPHEPKVDGIFYINDVPDGDGTHLEQLCDEFNADSDIDRELLKAATVTPFWGGVPGQRPAFVVRTDHGRGVGKSSTVKAIARIFEGPIKIGADEGRDQFMQRVLSDEGLKKRIIFLDNLKGGLDSADFEDLVTAGTLSGKKLYHGEASIPNLFTWFITSNNPELSTDLASRSVVINIGPKQHNKDFDTAIRAFIDDHRLELLGDIKAFLKRRARVDLNHNTRFPSWDNAVLSRFARGKAMVNTILRRAGEVDEEAQRADELFDLISGWIRSKGLDPKEAHVVIAKKPLQKLFQEFLAEFTVHIRTCYKHVRQYSSQPAFDGYTVERGRDRNTRGLLWVGPDAEPGTTPVVLDAA